MCEMTFFLFLKNFKISGINLAFLIRCISERTSVQVALKFKNYIHSAYAHSPKLHRKSSRKETAHICGKVKGNNEEGLRPIL